MSLICSRWSHALTFRPRRVLGHAVDAIPLARAPPIHGSAEPRRMNRYKASCASDRVLRISRARNPLAAVRVCNPFNGTSREAGDFWRAIPIGMWRGLRTVRRTRTSDVVTGRGTRDPGQSRGPSRTCRYLQRLSLWFIVVRCRLDLMATALHFEMQLSLINSVLARFTALKRASH